MKKYKMAFSYLVLIFIGIIPIANLFHSGLPITHDGQDHVARIANFYQNLLEGNLIPRWAPNLNWGYGHPILEFLYPLPSYIASLFHFLGFSLVDSLKIVFGLSFLLSGVFMYLWLREFLGEIAGVFGGVLYMFAPYRFVDLYVRGALGEHVAFVFPPLILFFILKLSKEKFSPLFIAGGSLAIAGLVLSHNAISIMFMPIIFLYILFIFYAAKNKKPQIYQYTSILVLGLGLSAFFWIPAFFEGKYTLRNIVTAGGYIGRFVNFRDLLYGPWSYGISGQFTVQLGIIHWVSFILSLLLLVKFYIKWEIKNLIFSLGLIVYTLIAIFLMLPVSNFIWQKFILLQNFQFPWRFLTVPVFTTSVLGALIYEQIFRKYKILILALSLVLVLILSKDYMRPKAYLYKPESFYTGIYKSTTDTGESSPIWSVRFMENAPKAHLELLDGDAKITETKRMSTYHAYSVGVKKKTLFAENTLYFPGWEVLVDGQKANIEFQDPQNRGLMTFYVDQGNHNISVIFRETKLRKFANFISLTSILLLTAVAFLKVARRRMV